MTAFLPAVRSGMAGRTISMVLTLRGTLFSALRRWTHDDSHHDTVAVAPLLRRSQFSVGDAG